MTKDRVFAEFKAYWQVADELLGKATKEQVCTVARILALHSAHYARSYGDLPLPNLFELLKITELSAKKVELLRDGTEALVGVLATVTAGLEDEPESPMQ